MTAYLILTQTVKDMGRYGSEYIPQVLPFLTKYGAEVVVAEFDAKPMQGNPPKSVVVLRFPSEQAIRNFIDDPAYQPVKKIRMDITVDGNAVIAPEFKMPG